MDPLESKMVHIKGFSKSHIAIFLNKCPSFINVLLLFSFLQKVLSLSSHKPISLRVHMVPTNPHLAGDPLRLPQGAMGVPEVRGPP